MSDLKPRQVGIVLGTPIDAINWNEATHRIISWAKMRASRYVCLCNVHSVITASRHSDFAAVLKNADMAAPDGAPIAWMLRRLGFPLQRRISGPDLMEALCKELQTCDVAIYLYGATESTLKALRTNLNRCYPGLQIAGSESPPFGNISEEERLATIKDINDSGAGIVFVGLGCPKQERWLASHRNKVKAVMIGVGAAFDFHAGTIHRAPNWMQKCGMEWFHRLLSEPRRLWKRYLVTNSLYLFMSAVQLANARCPWKK